MGCNMKTCSQKPLHNHNELCGFKQTCISCILWQSIIHECYKQGLVNMPSFHSAHMHPILLWPRNRESSWFAKHTNLLHRMTFGPGVRVFILDKGGHGLSETFSCLVWIGSTFLLDMSTPASRLCNKLRPNLTQYYKICSVRSSNITKNWNETVFVRMMTSTPYSRYSLRINNLRILRLK